MTIRELKEIINSVPEKFLDEEIFAYYETEEFGKRCDHLDLGAGCCYKDMPSPCFFVTVCDHSRTTDRDFKWEEIQLYW